MNSLGEIGGWSGRRSIYWEGREPIGKEEGLLIQLRCRLRFTSYPLLYGSDITRILLNGLIT